MLFSLAQQWDGLGIQTIWQYNKHGVTLNTMLPTAKYGQRCLYQSPTDGFPLL